MEIASFAHRLSLKQTAQGIFSKEEGWNTSHISIDGVRINTVNVFGIVINKESSQRQRSLRIDDSTSHLSVVLFDDTFHQLWEELNVGDLVRIIGKVRQYKGEIYLVPTILKKVTDMRWLGVHQKKWVKDTENKSAYVRQNTSEPIVVKESHSPERCIMTIKQLDKGEGVSMEELHRHIPFDNLKEIIHKLLLEGEIFEIRPGMVKTL